jgi:hypothetical protein
VRFTANADFGAATAQLVLQPSKAEDAAPRRSIRERVSVIVDFGTQHSYHLSIPRDFSGIADL